ncbi:hypothetical protein EDC65_2978 [Stella humosa]|uniref:DUF1579 domain-containing protein n=1 Tax=Stella humosa TaxID=94 RepID=A0A3N1LPG9_9PROT|nr:DUF1579 domain-containing protein [Stella humosa]ROP91115.1 hypothetical protein EDC65_2978 [Stella humosa]BBK34533.1 hypothetical protein STHU_51670 [Stella humosa]
MQTDGRHDFDFFFGQWAVDHSRLRERLAGCDRWDAFAGTCDTRPIIGGLGNVDDNRLELPGGTYEAATIRLFAPETANWSIWWVDGRRPRLEPPVHGRFADGVGTFFGDDTLDGRAIRVRFRWHTVTAHSATWEQAFSDDDGGSWETNWIMRFSRRA